MNTMNHHWQRFTLKQKLSRYAVYLVLIMAMVQSIQSVEVIPEFFFDAPEQMADMFSRMWPIDFAYYPVSVHDAMIETLNIATLGTLVTLIFALPLALMNASNIVSSPWVHWIARFFLVSSRSVTHWFGRSCLSLSLGRGLSPACSPLPFVLSVLSASY